jgi:hypothetical protein
LGDGPDGGDGVLELARPGGAALVVQGPPIQARGVLAVHQGKSIGSWNMTTGHSSTSHRTALGKLALLLVLVLAACAPGVNPEIGLTPEGMSVGFAGARDASRQPVALLAPPRFVAWPRAARAWSRRRPLPSCRRHSLSAFSLLSCSSSGWPAGRSSSRRWRAPTQILLRPRPPGEATKAVFDSFHRYLGVGIGGPWLSLHRNPERADRRRDAAFVAVRGMARLAASSSGYSWPSGHSSSSDPSRSKAGCSRARSYRSPTSLGRFSSSFRVSSFCSGRKRQYGRPTGMAPNHPIALENR